MTRMRGLGPGGDPRSPGIGARFARVRPAAAALLVAFALAMPPAALASSEQGIRQAGYLDRHAGPSGQMASGNILIHSGDRRAYQVVLGEQQILYEYDLDTLSILRTRTLPRVQAAETSMGTTEWLAALDDRGDRVFMFERLVDVGEDYRLFALDLRTLGTSQPRSLWPLGTRLPLAISYHAPSDRLYILSRNIVGGLQGRGVFFVEERTPEGEQVWEYPLAACYAALDHQYPPTVARSLLRPEFIYLNCYNSGTVQGLVVRITLGADGRPEGEDVFPAVPGGLSTMFDYGSDRMFFLTTISGAGRGAWVFDGLRSTFLGVIATGDDRPGKFAYSMGLDPRTGRLYMQTAAGFLVADARRTPLPSGLLFRHLAAPGVGSIQVDPLTRRVFVPDFTTAKDGLPQRYVILEDNVPLSSDPVPGNPDSLTAGVSEQAGVTAVNFSGGARAFAARMLTTGGIQKGAWNAALGSFSPENLPALWEGIQALPVDGGNRDLYLARVKDVSLTNTSADAAASAGDADAGTLRDLEKAGVKDSFPYSECHAGAGSGASAPATSAGSSASCDTEKATVVASSGSAYRQAQNDLSVSVESAFALGSVRREADRGLVSRAMATVTGITLFDRAWIGEFTTEAEAWAGGRPGTAGARFGRTISDVRVDSDGDGKLEPVCGDPCSLRVAADAVGRALAGQAAVEFPDPDPAYYPKGSPGGYQAIVQKGTFRSFAERALNDDDAAEVAGMQVVVYSDGRAGRTRQVIQIAGVQVEAHYGIYLLPTSKLPQTGGGEDSAAPTAVLSGGFEQPAGVFAPETAPSARTVIERVVRRIAEGFALFLSDPREGGLLAVLWSFLALPAYLLYRRRLIGGGG